MSGSEFDQIIATLRSADRPLKPRELHEKTGIPMLTLPRFTKALVSQGVLVASGKTNQRRYALAGTAAPLKPNTPAPAAGNGHAPTPAAPAPAGVAMVEARNLALKTRIKQGPATFAQLLEAMPEERDLNEGQRREACMRTVRRLLIKSEIREVGDTYRTV